MITASPLSAQYAETQPRREPRNPATARWQTLWRDALSDPRELLALVGLSEAADALLPRSETGFALRVPRGYVARMRYGDPADPLLLQALPRSAELDEIPGFTRDAVGDLGARVAAGVLHKYRGRALLITTGACAIHCRYCFRRHFPYAQETAAAHRWSAAIEHLRSDTTISEVILSGGDPLSLATPKLEELTTALAAIAHIRRLRIHTRLPIVLPERVDDELIRWLAHLPWPVAIVLHANHANELDAVVAEACARLRGTGNASNPVTLLNQSVLLRGVNDNENALADLSERLFACGVLPYYLHQLDKVAGAAHFAVDDNLATALIESLRVRLPGYLLPRLVREAAGEPYKTPL